MHVTIALRNDFDLASEARSTSASPTSRSSR
jgi:hypothetical protein